jgi:nucleoid-associated protein YejK
MSVVKSKGGRKVSSMFKYLSDKEQLLEEKRKNEALQSLVKDLEDAVIELAEIVAANEETLQEVQNG